MKNKGPNRRKCVRRMANIFKKERATGMGKSEKIKWQLLLFLAIGCYLLALVTQQYLFNVVAIGLAVCVYKYGSPVLFKEYDERKKKKEEEAAKVREAGQTILRNKTFEK